MKDFVGKTAVITGAGSGIGRALAQKLAASGAFLALADKDMDGLRATLTAMAPASGHARIYELDVSDREAVYRFADEVKRDFGHVDLLFNNAGVALSETVENMRYEDFEWVMQVNFWGVVYGTKAFLPMLKASPEAYLVNISSIFGLIGVPTQAAYNASKFAVRGFTEALRLELSGSSVTPVCVHPGGIKTNIARNSRFHQDAKGGTGRAAMEREFDQLARTTPERAAEIILDGVLQRRLRVLVGRDARVVDWLHRLLPEAYSRLMRNFL